MRIRGGYNSINSNKYITISAIFKSDRQRLLYCYAGIVIFTLYLIFDFNRLEQANANGDSSWGTAVDIAVALYLDIINLFLDILQAMAENQ